jgi:N6-adenosine-specific RNA methylase IME4/ParB-like chromosome segregation protein Spo0J
MCQRADRAAEEYAAETDGGARVDAEQNADVIQGRLGWESGDISEADPSNLRPHPKNTEIYGDTDDVDDLDATFKESVAEKGVLEPLVITNGKEIISGHRRWLAARDAGLTSVPVRYSEFDNDLTEREALIEFNRQREKTPGQIVNEFEEMLEIETQRQGQGERNDLKDTSGNVSGSYQSESREKAAEKVNADVSGRTLEKGKTVKDKAESDDEPEEVREAAREAWDGLQSGEESFNSAYTAVKDAEKNAEGGDGEDKTMEDVESEQTDSGGTVELPDAEYDVVYADPPWRYNFSKTSNREIENQYETMSLTDIKALEVPAGDDAVLYLWATAPKLPDAVDVLREWGFEYTTNLVWDKKRMGMGYWSRVQHEHLLIGTRGDVSPPPTDQRRRSVIRQQREEHSSKPDTVADMIAAQHDGADLIELFARDTRDGWDSWGKEAPAEVADD